MVNTFPTTIRYGRSPTVDLELANKAYVDSAGGQNNTASNVGSGAGDIFKAKVGVDLELKTILAGAGITVNNNTSEVEIVNTGTTVTADRALQSDGSGAIEASGVTATELALLSGATKEVKNMEFIAEVNLSGGVNAVIELTTGLNDYEVVMCYFELVMSGGSTFIPVMTVYDTGGELTGSYGINETVNGSNSKANATINIPLDGNTTGNSRIAGHVMITSNWGTNYKAFTGQYNMGLPGVSNAPDVLATFAGQHSTSNDIVGVKFENIGATSPTFSTNSKILICGIKKV